MVNEKQVDGADKIQEFTQYEVKKTAEKISQKCRDLGVICGKIILDYNIEEGKELIKKYDIKAVPFYVYSGEIKEAVNFAKIEQALVEKEGTYYINPKVGVSVKILQPPGTNKDHVRGKADASVTIIEWADFQCPFCGRWYEDTLPYLQKEYITTGKVKLVFKHFPLNFHENAQKAAEAAECAGEQGKFWEMHDLLFENQNALVIVDLKNYGRELGLIENEFNDCLNSGKMASKVKKDMQEGNVLDVKGTPAFLINDVFVSGALPYEHFEKLINEELQ